MRFGVLLVLLASACGGDDRGADAGAVDLAASVDPAATCERLGAWPSDHVSSKAESKSSGTFDFRTTLYADRPHEPGHVDRLRIELYHLAGSKETLPRSETLPSDGHYGSCNDCVLIDFDMDPGSGTIDNTFFARAGTLTVTRADRTAGHGTTTLRGDHVRFDEWSYDPTAGVDDPLPGGRCLEVESFQLSSDYTLGAADGGT